LVVRFDNYAKFMETRESEKYGKYNWYRWMVFVDEDDQTLEKIEYVQYLLHPTFRDPKRTVYDRKSKFALVSYGWGEFTIFITVRFKDGTEDETTYFLNLRKGWPEE